MDFEDDGLREIIRKIALMNAVSHRGVAQPGPVTGKLLSEQPELRERAKEVAHIVSEVVQDVNNLSLAEQEKLVKDTWFDVSEKNKEEEKKHLPPLTNVQKYDEVITRFSPNPDCVLHLGSARAIILCHEYAHMYGGRFLLRFEDTDPKMKRPVLEFYEKIREDLAWLGSEPDEEYIQSDRIAIYYKYADKLLRNGDAYVCTCKPAGFREKSLLRKPCGCRDLPIKEQLKRWQDMLNGQYNEGEAVVRIKTDLDHPNPAVRDWPALRIIDCERYPHPRVGSKYHVWPLYNFACGIDDHLMGVTYIIRGKEHLTNMVRQKYMYRHLGWEYPEAIHYGRLKITGASLSKSKIVQGIRERLYDGWDDPRLATFAALRRRGIMPDSIRNMMIDVGPKPSDVTLSWKNLYAYNRKILDPKADRYFFVHDPVQLKVDGISKAFTARLRLHPDFPERGFREYTIKPKGEDESAIFWISRRDAEVLKVGENIRLMELFNIRIDDVDEYPVEASFFSESHEAARKHGLKLIHWIPVDTGIPCLVVMPDASRAEGTAEKACHELKPNKMIQFERFGFVRIDEVNERLIAYYTHR